MDPVRSFLLNKGMSQGAGVDAPAFSLTKVLASAAIVIGPLATLLVDKLSHLNFSAGQVVALALGLLGFLAVTASADVLGRSMVAAAKATSDAAAERTHEAQAGVGRLVPFPHPVSGRAIADGEDPAVQVLASAYGDQSYFLVRDGDGALSWLPAAKVTFGERTEGVPA